MLKEDELHEALNDLAGNHKDSQRSDRSNGSEWRDNIDMNRGIDLAG